MCEVVRLADGTTMIMCGRAHGRQRPRPCVECVSGALVDPTALVRISALLCDGPGRRGSTCDRPLCLQHATEVGPDRHLCPRCAAQQRLEVAL